MSRRSRRSGPRCGGYRVTRRGGRILVRCAVCGPCGRLTAAGARRLAAQLRGLFGRFETTAPRPERLRLADLLERAASHV